MRGEIDVESWRRVYSLLVCGDGDKVDLKRNPTGKRELLPSVVGIFLALAFNFVCFEDIVVIKNKVDEIHSGEF